MQGFRNVHMKMQMQNMHMMRRMYSSGVVQNSLRTDNNDVKLGYTTEKWNDDLTSMIVLHGLLGSMKNWRSMVRKPQIYTRRNCFLVEQRNHAMSDHHSDMNYNVMSDDIIRLADSKGLNKFTLLGHSLGGRAAMTTACRYPDRVDGVISIDSAPVNESAGKNQFGRNSYQVLSYMNELSQYDLTTQEAITKVQYKFKHNQQFINLIMNNMDQKSLYLKWLSNIPTLYDQFSNVPYFNTNLRYQSKNVFQIVGGKSLQYDFEQYQAVFPNIEKENIAVVPDAGHWVQFDKPTETADLIGEFLEKIDDNQIYQNRFL